MSIVILLVESDPISREAITYALELSRYIVIPVSSAFQAYESLDAVIIDAIIVSSNPKNLDMLQTAYEAKAYQRGVRVIFVGYECPPDIPNLFIDAYIQKPYAMLELDLVIRRVTGLVEADLSSSPGYRRF